MPGRFALKFDGVCIEWGTTPAAIGQAREQVRRVFPAGVMGVVRSGEVLASILFVEVLHLVPSFFVYHRFTIPFDDLVSKMEIPFVNRIFEKCGVGVDGAVELGLFVYLAVGSAGSPHLPGFFDEWGEIGIRHPLVDDVRGSIAPFAEFDRLTKKTTGRCSPKGAVLADQVVQPTLGFFGEFLKAAVIGPVNGRFEETPVQTSRDGVGDGVDIDPFSAKIGFEVLGVVDIAAEAGEGPKDNPGF